MMGKQSLALALVGLACLCAPVAPVLHTQAPQVAIPKPGVPQIMTLEGTFVRAAYNNEGYVILGYQLAQRSLTEDWMLLEVGMTLRDGVQEQTVKRDAHLAGDARRQDHSNGNRQRAPRSQHHCAATTRESAAGFDQLFSAERNPRMPNRFLRGSQ